MELWSSLLLLGSAYVLIRYWKWRQSDFVQKIGRIPGLEGLPFIGSTFSFPKDKGGLYILKAVSFFKWTTINFRFINRDE